jgi:hypothetical protein
MTRADRLVLVASLATLGWLYSTIWGQSTAGDTAKILIPGKPAQVISLKKDKVYKIHGRQGTSTLAVEDGRIRFVDSPCASKQCVLSGWLAENGDFTACLPNRVSVVVAGANPRYDTINF